MGLNPGNAKENGKATKRTIKARKTLLALVLTTDLR